MYRVLVYGAGSIGNHLTYACRQKGWHVDLTDIDPIALERTKTKIYPDRYGSWDRSICLLTDVDRREVYDLVIIGTPPDTHIDLALNVLSSHPPKVLMIEKPLCTPFLDNLTALSELDSVKCQVLVGYNHNVTENTERAEKLLTNGYIGTPYSMHARWQETWAGIFAAHPWLDGPSDTYLGFWGRGGGACAEHSHAISLWQHFARVLEYGEIKDVLSVMDMCNTGEVDYDRTAQIILKTEKGLIGTVIQDVVTDPPIKTLRLQGDEGFLEWYAGYDASSDALVYGRQSEEPTIELIPKTRSDDFSNQIDSVGAILSGSEDLHPNRLELGIKTMEIVAAAHLSHRTSEIIDVSNDEWQSHLNMF